MACANGSGSTLLAALYSAVEGQAAAPAEDGEILHGSRLIFDGPEELDPETVLAQFNRLMNDLLRGGLSRNTFRRWEIEILLDIETCQLRDGQRRETLRRYQRAVQRHMEKGLRNPMKLSEYLATNRARRSQSGDDPNAAARVS